MVISLEAYTIQYGLRLELYGCPSNHKVETVVPPTPTVVTQDIQVAYNGFSFILPVPTTILNYKHSHISIGVQ